MNVISRNLESVKAGIVAQVATSIEGLVASACEEAASTAELERRVAGVLVELGQQITALSFAAACRAAMLRDVQARGLRDDQVRVRSDEGGYITVNTTVGPVAFPTFVYRDLSGPVGAVIRHPERSLFPYHARCRSSPLCLEWEVKVGSQCPFRKAEDMLRFFTRGASTVEDTRIAAHILHLGTMVDPSWTYRTPEEIRAILTKQATRDSKTNGPILYVSCDASALRRYEGQSWARGWKMTNGIRIWCEDAKTKAILHLGGEYSWGDCRVIGARFAALAAAGVLPDGSEAWAAVGARVIFLSDGSEWLAEHVIPVLRPALVILDPYHALEWIAAFAAQVFGPKSSCRGTLNADARRLLLGANPHAPRRSALRRGHTKRRGTRRRHAHDHHRHPTGRRPYGSADHAPLKELLDILAALKLRGSKHLETREALVARLAKNAHRMDYLAYLAQGLQIGSGAMESLHRQASQIRLKLPGATWLEESSQAILNFRMLELVGRSGEFWSQPDLANRIVQAFGKRSERSEEPAAAEA
jgi:hypothetical protein